MTTNQPNATPEAIFHQARAMTSPEERAAYLARACAGDAALLARVEALLRAEAEAGSFLGTKDRAAATTREAPLLERAGQTIGHYKLLQLIGEGGFGAVFMAQQDVPVRRRVALKIIKPGMDSRMVAARFEAERQALALMDHPHIARVFDGGVTDPAMGARPYFVMEYVKGDPITAFADAHQLSIEDRLALFTQVCEAVQHAHTKGIIHRDLKPANVLVSMVDGKPFAKVIDFGIAKATGAALTDKTLFTEHRQLIGTPEYMSPEQAEGSPDIDTRADVYALGVLLYELLTGATPFDGARLRSAAFAEMQRIIKEEEPPMPSLRLTRDVKALGAAAAARRAEPARLGTMVKGELDWIVMKALDKDRGRRYETPSQFAEDVKRHLAGAAVVAAPASAGYRLRKFVRRNKGAVVAGTAIAMVMLAGIAATTWQWRHAKRFNDELVAVSENMRARLEATAATLFADDSPFYMKPKHGGSLYVQGGTELGVVLRRDEHTDAVRAMASDELRGERPLGTTEALNALGYFSSMTIDQMMTANRDLLKANAQLRTTTDSAIDALSEIIRETHGTGQGTMAVSSPLPDGRQFTWAHTTDESGKSRLLIVEGGLGSTAKALEDPSHPLPPAPPDVAMSLLTTEIRATLAQLHAQTDAAEWSAYTANFILALQALDARDYAQARSYLDACAPRCRGFEWQRARLQASAVMLQLSSNGEPDTPALVSRDGRRVVLPCVRRGPDGFNTESAEVWNTAVWPPQKVGDLPISLRGGKSVSVSPDGARAVFVTNDGAFLVRESNPAEILRLPERDGSAIDATFSPDGRSVAVATSADSGSVVLWAVPDMQPVEQQRLVIGSTPEFVRFNADGSRLLVGGRQSAIWDLTAPRPEVVARIDSSNFNIPDGMFASDGSEVLLAGVEPAVATLWDIAAATPRRRVSMRGHRASVLSTSIQPQTGRVLTVSYDDSVRLWARSGQCLGGLRLDGPQVVNVDACNVRAAFRPDGRLAIVPRNNAVLFVDPDAFTDTSASSPDIVRSVAEQEGDGLRTGLALTTPDGSRRIVGGEDKTIRFYEAKDGKPTLPATAEMPGGVFREVAVFRMDDVATNLQMTSDGTRLVIRLADGSARVWDIRDSEERRKDLQAVQAERGPAGQYLDALWASDTPDGDLREAVIADAGLTALRRLVAVEMLDQRLEDDHRAALEAFSAIKKAIEPAAGSAASVDGTALKAELRAKAAGLDLPKRVKARVIFAADRWEYTPPEPSDAEKLAAETKRARLAEARNLVAKWATGMGAPGSPIADLRDAVVTLAECEGAASAEAVRAEMMLVEEDKADVVPLLDHYLAMIARRDALHVPAEPVDQELRVRLAQQYWSESHRDAARWAETIHWVGRELAGIQARNPEAILLIPSMDAPGTSIHNVRRGEHAWESEQMQSVTPQTMFRRLAVDRNRPLADRLGSIERAEAMDAESGRSPNPANLAVRAIMTMPTDARAASALLKDAEALVLDAKWAKDHESTMWVAEARGVLDPESRK